MPNHVTHKIIFSAEHAATILPVVCPDGQHFDFETLVPSPLQMYRGNLGKQDDEDFLCNWNTWCRANWGTKWGAYQGSVETVDGNVCIKFQTAWSVPYPIMAAFANRFGVPFEHRYCDECPNFWGVETWGFDEWPENRDKKPCVRLTKRLSADNEREALMLELLGRADEEESA